MSSLPWIERPGVPLEFQDLFDYRKPFFAYGGAAAYASNFDAEEFASDLNVQAAYVLADLPRDEQMACVAWIAMQAHEQGWEKVTQRLRSQRQAKQ